MPSSYVSPRLRLAITALGMLAQDAVFELEAALTDLEAAQETARINPTKTYKPRRLKMDPIHRMARQLYKMKVKNPSFKRKDLPPKEQTVAQETCRLREQGPRPHGS